MIYVYIIDLALTTAFFVFSDWGGRLWLSVGYGIRVGWEGGARKLIHILISLEVNGCRLIQIHKVKLGGVGGD